MFDITTVSDGTGISPLVSVYLENIVVLYIGRFVPLPDVVAANVWVCILEAVAV